MDGHRTLVRGATVIDGTGDPARPLDVLLRADRIEATGPPGAFDDVPATVLDARGTTVCPGFVDVHSHADQSPLLERDDISKIRQGVTTEVVGNCGFSLAPAHPDPEFRAFLTRLFPPQEVSWTGFGELLGLLDERGYVTNYCPLVGHGALRCAVTGMAPGAPDRAELAAMRLLLEQSLSAGAFGLSSGLTYPPSLYAEHTELTELARCLDDTRVYTTHLRSEGAGLLDAVQEALALAREAGCRLQVSHLKAMGRPNWGATAAALSTLDRARDSGMRVAQDVYPYTAASTSLLALLPPSFLTGTSAEVLERLSAPGAAHRLADAMRAGAPGWENRAEYAGWDGVLLAGTGSGRHEGRTLAELAGELALEPVETLVHVLVSERLRVTASTFTMDESDVRRVLAHPATMVGSDGLPVGPSGKPHPRLFGTFPRVLGHYLRDRPIGPAEDVIHRMTGRAADWFHIPDRGRIGAGMVADLVAFDPLRVCDRATYTEPDRGPDGLAWVMLGGRVVVREGRYGLDRLGRRLTPAS